MTTAGAPALFWIAATLMTAAALGFVLPALLFPRSGRNASPSSERASGRANASTCAVAADAAPPCVAEVRSGRRLAVAVAIALPLIALGLYEALGDPGAISATAFSEHASPSRDDLVRHLAGRPRDGRGWVMLARLEFEAERYADAAAAFDRAVAASANVARDPAVWCEYADALGMAQGGVLTGRPHELVLRALALDPRHPKALEMAGSAAFELEDYATAAGYWRTLIAQLPLNSRPRDELEAALARVEALATAAAPRAAPPRNP